MSLAKHMDFVQWFHKNLATEQPFEDIASLVKVYLGKKPSLLQIKNDTEGIGTRSKEYLPIAKAFRSGRGVLLYCILDISRSLSVSYTGQDQLLLAELRNHLEAIFISYTDEPALHLKAILRYIDEYLQLKPDDLADKKRANELYYTFYLALCTVNCILNNPPIGSGLIAAWYQIDLQATRKAFGALIKKIEDNSAMVISAVTVQNKAVGDKKSVALTNNVPIETVSTPKVASSKNQSKASQQFSTEQLEPLVTQVTLSDTQRVLQDSFDKRYLEIFTSTQSSAEKVSGLLKLSAEINATVDAIKDARVEEAKILERKNSIVTLLLALNTNNDYILGRKYFLELKDAYAAQFKLLFDLSDCPEKQALLSTIVEQEHNTTQANRLYWLSTIASPLIALSRALLAKETQDYWASVLPETLDAKAKALAVKLIGQVIPKLNEELELIKQKREGHVKSLALGDELLTKKIAEESTESLIQLAQLNSVSQKIEELEVYLIPRPNDEVQVKLQIQEIFQQHYASVLQAEESEKGKIELLIEQMRSVAANLKALAELKAKKEEMLLKINSLQTLMNVFNQQTDNKLIGAVPNKLRTELAEQLTALNSTITDTINRIATGNESLGRLLWQASSTQLNELIAANEVGNQIDKPLLTLVNTIPFVAVLPEKAKRAQQYLNERYIGLFNHDAYDEDKRLQLVERAINQVDQQIDDFLAVRSEYLAAMNRAQQLKDMLSVLEANNANDLLINLTRERVRYLDNNLNTMQSNLMKAANILAQGNAKFTNCALLETKEALLEIKNTNQAAKGCLAEYLKLKEKIVFLNQIKTGDSGLNSYITLKNTWWVRLTNYLAQFLSIFKTQAGKMVDEARLLQHELIGARIQCELEINDSISTIKQNPHLGKEMVAEYSEVHRYEHSDEELSAAAACTDKLGLLAKLSLFRIVFPENKVPVVELDEEEQVDNFEDGSGYGYGYN